MDRVKHNIAVVLALFGVVFIAPAALAQTTGSARGEAAIQVIPRGPTIAPDQSLEFGEVFRPAAGSRIFGVDCESDGDVTEINPDLIAGGSRQCGQVTLTPGDTTVSLNLRFGGSPATDVVHSNTNTLVTTYTLTDADGNDLVEDHPADGISMSTDSGDFDVASGPAREFYIGGTVLIPFDATSGEYTGAYEVIFTIVP